jgi:ribosome-binding protein aMBF1 (putative translation factor)
MNEVLRQKRLERTPEQIAEERRIRELHRQQPIRVIPTETVDGADMPSLLKFVAAVRREREACGMSVEQLAERSGMDVDALARLEAAQNFNPSAATMFRLTRALGKSLQLAIHDPSAPESV